ncbi:MAG: hypothetical protein WCQ64_07155, partial [Acidobacteriota bacterium]
MTSPARSIAIRRWGRRVLGVLLALCAAMVGQQRTARHERDRLVGCGAGQFGRHSQLKRLLPMVCLGRLAAALELA